VDATLHDEGGEGLTDMGRAHAAGLPQFGEAAAFQQRKLSE
jgi:hypothetical protein